MAEAYLDIKKWGNNLGVRLPAAVAREANLHTDQRVHVTVEGNRVIIEPVVQTTIELEQLLERFDRARHGGEVMSSDRIGAERW